MNPLDHRVAVVHDHLVVLYMAAAEVVVFGNVVFSDVGKRTVT